MPKHQTEPFLYDPNRAEEETKTIPTERVTVTENPRRIFDPDALESLAQSIDEDGLLQPISVRPGTAGGNRAFAYELLAGERRLRAIRDLLGRDEIRATIVHKDDEQARRLRLVENFEREDLHPIEEAEAYRELMDDHDYTAAEAAELTGRSVSYVWQTVKLLELSEPATEAFMAGEINRSHAKQLARLTGQQQKIAFAYITRRPTGYRAKMEKPDTWMERDAPCSAAELARWIQEALHLNLHAAPFRMDDEELLPSAGPCTTCPKRTGFEPALFPEIEDDDVCTDRSCYGEKLQAHIDRQLAEWEEEQVDHRKVTTQRYAPSLPEDVVEVYQYRSFEGKEKEACEDAVPGIVVHGPRRGTTFPVCPKNGSCDVHWRKGGKSQENPFEKWQSRWRTERFDRRAEVGEAIRQEAEESAQHWPVQKKLLRIIVARMFAPYWTGTNDEEIAEVLGWEIDRDENGRFDMKDVAWANTEDASVAELLEALWVLAIESASTRARFGAYWLAEQLDLDTEVIERQVATKRWQNGGESNAVPLPEDLVTLESYEFRLGQTAKHIAHYEDERPLCGGAVGERDDEAEPDPQVCGNCARGAFRLLRERGSLAL